MSRVSPYVWQLGIAAALVAVAVAGVALADGDYDDLVEVKPQPPRMVFRPAAQIQISERNIDAWVYGNQSRGREWIEASLKQRVDEIGRVCQLTDMQKEKLILAGAGDIQHFESRVDELRAQCKAGTIAADQYNRVYQSSLPLRATLQQGLFGGGSLFHKTLLSTLRPEQVALCEQTDRERRVFRYRARVELLVAQLDAILGLRDEQRRQLIQLILDKTRPPRVFGQTDRFLVMIQMTRLPEESLKSLLDAGQWREMQKQLANAKRMVRVLKQSGVVFDDGTEPVQGGDFNPAILNLGNRPRR